MSGRRQASGDARGASLVEIAVTLTVIGLAAGVALPALAALRDGGRLSAGGRAMAAELHGVRWRAVASGRTHGLDFARDAHGWYWVEVADANGNGLRRDEIASGVDAILGAPQRLEHRVRGVRVGIPAEAPHPAPPGSGAIGDLDDPVRFGSSDLIALGARGGGTGGTLHLCDGRGGWIAVVLYGPTARLRVWRFDRRAGQWR